MTVLNKNSIIYRWWGIGFQQTKKQWNYSALHFLGNSEYDGESNIQTIKEK